MINEENIQKIDRTQVVSRVRRYVAQDLKSSNYLVRHGVDPKSLVWCSRRIDVGAKLRLAKSLIRGRRDEWSEAVYEEILFRWSHFYEDNQPSQKIGREAFYAEFGRLIESVKQHGFNEKKSLIPVGKNGEILDGSHRVAVCAALNVLVSVVEVPEQMAEFNHEFFRNKGVDEEVLQNLGLEFCLNCPDTYIIVIFPSAHEQIENIKGIIRRKCDVIYEREVPLNENGSLNLIIELYSHQQWIGGAGNSFSGARSKRDSCFTREGPVHVFAVRGSSGAEILHLKSKIRALIGIGNHSIHTTDSHEETKMAASMLFNSNSVARLNSMRVVPSETFRAKLDQLIRVVARQDGLEFGRDVCVSGSSVLELFSLREAADLDLVVGSEYVASAELHEMHNGELIRHGLDPDTVIGDPRKHLFWQGIKFMSPSVLYCLKERRGEAKDMADILLLENLLKSGAYRKPITTFSVWRKLVIKMFALKRHIRARIPTPIMAALRAGRDGLRRCFLKRRKQGSS